MIRFSMIALAVAVAGLLVVAPATAQQQGVPPQQEEAPEVDVDEDELAAVAEAYVDVQNLTNEFNQVVQQAEGAEEAQAVQAEYAERANEAVEAHGLSVERYDMIVRAATADEELRERLLGAIENVVGGAAPNE